MLQCSSCDYPCIWPAKKTDHFGSCYEIESCFSEEPESLISTAENIAMYVNKGVVVIA